MTADLLERTTERTVQTSNNKPECAHIVLGNGGESGTALVLRARIEGFPVTALCGYTWIPQRSAQGLPVCEECVTKYKHDPKGHGDRDDLPDE